MLLLQLVQLLPLLFFIEIFYIIYNSVIKQIDILNNIT